MLEWLKKLFWAKCSWCKRKTDGYRSDMGGDWSECEDCYKLYHGKRPEGCLLVVDERDA
jgi:hypothetical protein